MNTMTAEKSKSSFLGVLRTSRGTVILVAVENMPLSPVDAPELATNARHGTTPNRQKGERVSAGAFT